jgi:hypothetical protein
MRRMLATLAVGIAGGMIGALIVTAVPATGSPGDSMILSSVNQAGPMTVLKSNGGFRILAKKPQRPPLMVYTPDEMPPLQVSSRARVANLNADLLDGKDAGQFLGTLDKAADAHRLDGLDSSAFLRRNEWRRPAAAFAGGAQSVEVTTNTTVRSLSMIPPDNGVVIVNSTVTLEEDRADDSVACSITTGNTLDQFAQQVWESSGYQDGGVSQLAGTRGFDVSRLSYFTVRLVCSHFGTSPSSQAHDSQLTAVFIPDLE